MSHQEQRHYYLKSYALWWLGMAWLGSLVLNGPSKTFIQSAYNPVAWSGAALLALLFATLQTNFRPEIRRFFAHPLVFWTGAVGYFGIQSFSLWERQIENPSLLRGTALGFFCLITVLLLLGWCASIHKTFGIRAKPDAPKAPTE
ncbi:MAG: hypothetical protein H7145_07265 [Akkermansiaceae bacterium]|nr:hypothetical protein [Armatimonadota bacterium]